MIHSNVPNKQKPKAKMRATGEVIRKNGTRQPIKILGDDVMTKAELDAQMLEEAEQEKNEVN